MKMRPEHHFRDDRGFTLMELMAVIVAASIVTLAATTLMLFGLRANNRTIDAMKQQNTSRILMQTLEAMTMDTDIGKIEDDYGTWKVHGMDGGIRFSYSPSSQTIYAGSPEKGTPILENVLASQVTLDEVRKLLTFSVTTEEGTYSSSVFCRVDMPDVDKDDAVDNVVDNLQDENTGNDNIGTESSDARLRFLRVLANQYKIGGKLINNGQILNSGKESIGTYYSEWYINPDWWTLSESGYEDYPGWNEQTPWCACFLSWGLNQVADAIDTVPADRLRPDRSGRSECYWYASVDHFVAYFNPKNTTDFSAQYWIDNANHHLVRPGDLIVFDWNLDNDPSHIGAVLMMDGDRVYTIEGNTSNRVGVRSYKLTDPRILGYGVIDWAADAGT